MLSVRKVNRDQQYRQQDERRITSPEIEPALVVGLGQDVPESGAKGTSQNKGDPEKERMREFRDVTPIAYARQFQEPQWVSEPALAAIADAGGTA